MLKTLAGEAGLSGADFLRQMLRKHWADATAASRQAKVERLLLVSLNEMANRPGIGCAVAFSSEPGLRHMPLARGDNGPQPVASSVLEAPMLGNIVTQGFARAVSEQEKTAVEARFPGQLATWLFNS